MSAEDVREDIPDDYDELYGPDPSGPETKHVNNDQDASVNVAEAVIAPTEANDAIHTTQNVPGIPGLTGNIGSSSEPTRVTNGGTEHDKPPVVTETPITSTQPLVNPEQGFPIAQSELNNADRTTSQHEVEPKEADVTMGDSSEGKTLAADPLISSVAVPEASAPVSNGVVAQQAVVQQLLNAEGDREFLEAAQANQDNPGAEWQYDSSDMETSSSDSDSDSSSSEDSDADGDYEMLDPATAARMLMAEEGGEEDDGPSNKTGNKASVRTKNEIEEQIVPKPDVTVTDDMKLIPLGRVENVVENLALIKGFNTGEYQVLEQGSVLCLENRTVIGAVSETFGRVQEPLYSVAFTNGKEIEEMGIKHGITIFYVAAHSTFVFTQPLKGLKGTDASNIHDEEVGDEEAEFSDDEAERAHKQARNQAKKNQKAGIRDADAAPSGFHTANAHRKLISYDDVEDGAPQSGHLQATEQARPNQHQRNFPDRGRGRGGRGRGSGRGRGQFGREDRSRGGNYSGGRNQQQSPATSHHRSPGTNSFTQHSANTFTAPNPGSSIPHLPGFNLPPNLGNPQYGNSGWQAQAQTAPYGQQQSPMPSWPQPLQQQPHQYNQQQPPSVTNAPFPTGAHVNPAFWAQQTQSNPPAPYWPAPGQQNPAAAPPPPPPNYQALLQNIELLRRMNGNQQ